MGRVRVWLVVLSGKWDKIEMSTRCELDWSAGGGGGGGLGVGRGLWGGTVARAERSLFKLRLSIKSAKRKHQQSSGDKGQWHFTAFVYAATAALPSNYITQLDALLPAE
jgi:hypothetical protein